MLAVYIATKNSPSGNPQRGWIIFNADGGVAGFVDEGYQGKQALDLGGYAGVPSNEEPLEATAATYKRWCKRRTPT